MTLRQFKARLKDPAYREAILARLATDSLSPEVELLLWECSWGKPKPLELTPLQSLRIELAERRPQYFRKPVPRTGPRPGTPWPAVLHWLVRTYRARPGYSRPATATEEVAAIREEAFRHLQTWPRLRNQLADVIHALDDAFPPTDIDQKEKP